MRISGYMLNSYNRIRCVYIYMCQKFFRYMIYVSKFRDEGKTLECDTLWQSNVAGWNIPVQLAKAYIHGGSSIATFHCRRRRRVSKFYDMHSEMLHHLHGIDAEPGSNAMTNAE